MLEDADERKIRLTSALCDAAWNDRVSELETLIANGADVNGSDDSGQPPLWYAIENGASETVKWLLEHGANVAKYENMIDGWTPLAHEVEDTDNIDRQPRTDVIALLLKFGADPEVSARPLNKSPLDYSADLFLHPSTVPMAEALFKVFLAHARSLKA